MFKSIINIILVIFCIGLLPKYNHAQDFIRFDDIKVTQYGNTLRYAWTGGVNSVQLGKADVNNDGIKDVVLYDKSNAKYLIFLALNSNSTSYKFDNSYAINFPPIDAWMVMKDYNCDDIEDIFTYDYSGTGSAIIYTGYYLNDTLHYKLQQVGLFYQGNFVITNVLLSSTIKPAIADINQDGDLDIVTFVTDGSLMTYYENLQKEKNLPCDSLFFKKVDRCWGNVTDVFTSTFQLRDTCTDKFYRLSGNEQILHSGSAMDAIDIDNNGAVDMLIGSIGLFNLTMLYNYGDTGYASILSQDVSFPSYNTSYNISAFGVPTFIDVNNDNETDLLVTTYDDGADNINNIWYYKNNGNTSNQFELQQKNFLLDNMIDAGENSYPCFIDADGDGLTDILVGSGGFKDNINPAVCKLLLYKNTGTASIPAFTLTNDDFLSISSLNVCSLAPTVGDIDNDGDTDIVIGISDGRMLLYENTAGVNQVPVFIYKGILKDATATNISVGANAAPYIIDLDRDGKNDLVIGERNGNLNFYKGNLSNAVNLTYITDSLGKIKIETYESANGYTHPCITDINHDGKYDLVLGTNYSGLQLYDNIEANILGTYTTSSVIVSDYLGQRTTATIADITNDGQLELLTGNKDGGLIIFSESPPDIPSTLFQNTANIPITIFPNPVHQQITIEQKELSGNMQLQIINMLGQTIIQQTINNENRFIIDASTLANGMYILKLSDGVKEGMQKIVIQH